MCNHCKGIVGVVERERIVISKRGDLQSTQLERTKTCRRCGNLMWGDIKPIDNLPKGIGIEAEDDGR